VPGTAIVQVVEIGPDGIKRPLSSWDISQDQLRHSWKNGLLTTGYVLVLPWKVWPSTEKLRVTVQFRLADGRLFEADREVTVRVAPINERPRPAPVIVPSVPAPEPLSPSPPKEISLPLPTRESKEPAREMMRPPVIEPAVNRKVQPAAEILRPIPVVPVNAGGSWQAPIRTSSAD
jgi:hypothetical protein